MAWLRKWYERNRDASVISEQEDRIHLRVISVLVGAIVICFLGSVWEIGLISILPVLCALAMYGFICWIYKIDHGRYPWDKKAP